MYKQNIIKKIYMIIIHFLLCCQVYTFTFHPYITLLLIHFLPGSNETLPSPKAEPTGTEAVTQESLAAAETCDVPQLKDLNLSTEPLSDDGTGFTEHLCFLFSSPKSQNTYFLTCPQFCLTMKTIFMCKDRWCAKCVSAHKSNRKH